MDRQTLDRWCERGILSLVVAILFFGPLAYGAVRTIEFVVLQFSVLAVVLLWILRVWISPRPVFFWPPVCWAVLAFVGYAIVRYRLAPIEYVARLELIKVLTYALLFFAVLNNLSRQESTQIIAISLICLAFAQSIFAVFQFITHSNKIWSMIKPEGYAVRGSGTYINPNILAGLLEMILPLSLAYMLIGRFGHVAKVVFGYLALSIVVGIGVTLSRGGWVASGLTLVVLLVVLLFRRDSRLRSIIALSVLLVLGVAFVAVAEKSKKRFEQLASSKTMEDDRVNYWKIADQIWREEIWLGAGPGHFDYRYRQYRPPILQGRPLYAHNDYLNTLADWGIAGLGLAMGFIALFFAGVFKTWRFVQRSPNDLGTKSSNKAAFVLGGSLGVLAILFHSFVDFNMHIPANAIVALTLIALVTTYLRFATESFWTSLGIFSKAILTLVCLAGIFYLGQQGMRQLREHELLIRAEREKEFSERKMDLLKQAFSAEPKNFETAFAIGEIFRGRSLVGNRGYEAAAQEAMTWFQRSMALNQFHPFSYVSYGILLDWIGKTDEGAKYFQRASELDPNGYFTIAHLGWHRLQLGDYIGAKKEFERSENLRPNPIAESNLEIIEQRLAEPPGQ
ncbi:MAG: O-antigen ligase family protein [Verrucomicrobiota bacterium]